MALTLAAAQARIDAIFSNYVAATSPTPSSVLSPTLTPGKVYEAWVLSVLLEGLRVREHFDIELVASTKVVLKGAPGPINRAFAHFLLRKAGSPTFEVWTDIEFMTLGHSMRSPTTTTAADYHELDIVVLPNGVHGRPSHAQVLLGVECKHTSFQKSMARAAFGVRRELSLLRPPNATVFSTWPRTQVPADPPSVFAVYSSDPAVIAHQLAGQTFGVDFVHEPM